MVVVLADAANPTAPLPVPDAPDVIVSQSAFDAADHEQPAVVFTVIDPGPPESDTVWAVGASV